MAKNTDMAIKVWNMIYRYSPNPLPLQQYSYSINSSPKNKFIINVDYHIINTNIKHLNLGQTAVIRFYDSNIKHLNLGQTAVIRFYDYTNDDYKEDAYIVIKAYKHRDYRRFSMKVFYMNSKENVIHPMLLEAMGHSYELKFNDESIKYGMGWSIRNAIYNVLHMCYAYIYDYCMLPIVVINDKKPQRMKDAVVRFIDKIQTNYESPRSCTFMVESVPNATVTVTVCPSYANITVHDKGVVTNYPLFPIPAERKRILVSHPQPIFKLVNMILTKTYSSGLYRRRFRSQYVFGKLIQGTSHSRYNVKSNPETKEVTFANYTEENLAKLFTERLQEVAFPFTANLFRYEYAYLTHDKNSVGYTMKIGVLMLKDYAAVYAYEMRDGHNRAVSICSKTVSPIISNIHDEFTSTLISEHHNAISSGVNTELIATVIAEYARKWLGKARRANRK